MKDLVQIPSAWYIIVCYVVVQKHLDLFLIRFGYFILIILYFNLIYKLHQYTL